MSTPAPDHIPGSHVEENGLALDAEDYELLREAEENPDALVSGTPAAQKLGIFSVMCLIVNRMIGTGIFSTPGVVIKGTDSVATALIIWVFGGAMAFMSLSMYLELGLSIPKYNVRGSNRPVSVPRSGGEKNYLEYIYKQPKFLAVCVFAVTYIAVGHTAGNGIAFAQYFLRMVGNDDPTPGLVKGVGLAAITFACLLHFFWRAGGIWANNVIAVIKVCVLLVIIVTGFVAWGGGLGSAKKNAFESGEIFDKSSPYGYTEAFMSVIFSYSGFMNANYVLSEVHKPQETLKKGSFSALGFITVLYILTNIAYLGALTKQEIKGAGVHVAAKFFFNAFGGDVAANRVLPGLVALSSFGNIIVVTFVACRVKAEIAKEGVLPFSRFFATNSPTVLSRFFGRKESDTGKDTRTSEHAPAGALLLHWIFSMIIIASPPVTDAYAFFVDLYAYTNEICFGAFMASGLLWLRFKPKSTWVAESSFKPWGGPTMTIILLMYYLFLIVAPFIPPGAGTAQLTMPTIKWYVFPVVGISLFVGGVIYWLGFRFVWPKLYKRELYVHRVPILLDGVQIHEIVICSWVVPGTPEVEDHQMEHDPLKLWDREEEESSTNL